MTTRTTVTLADDVAAAVDRYRREEGVGVSEAVNTLVRRGLISGSKARKEIVPLTFPTGVRIDVSNVAEALDLLDQLEEQDRLSSAG